MGKGRIAKKGFAYYSSETDRYNDLRIKKLVRAMGPNGIAIYDYILNEIYRVEGCYLEWDESVLFDVAHYFNVKESLVEEVVKQCCNVGLFHKGVLDNGGALTSASIQLRYFNICELLRRKAREIPPEYRVDYLKDAISPEEIDEKPPLEVLPSEENGVLSEENGENDTGITQRKEKKRKEKEIEEKAADVHNGFLNELLSDVKWCQDRCIQYGLPDDGFKVLKDWLIRFNLNTTGAKKYHETLQAFAWHFMNYMNKQGLNDKKPGGETITYVDGQAVKGNIHGHASNY